MFSFFPASNPNNAPITTVITVNRKSTAVLVSASGLRISMKATAAPVNNMEDETIKVNVITIISMTERLLNIRPCLILSLDGTSSYGKYSG
jgi:short-subunit dehydrogenase